MVRVEEEHNLAGVFREFEVIGDTVLPAFETFAAAALEEARRDWPVDTGTSQDAWQVEINTANEGEISVELSNAARHPKDGRSYAAYVHRSGTPNNDASRVWKEKETEIIESLLPTLMSDCLDIIIETMEV